MTQVAIITDQHFGARGDSPIFLDFYEKFYSEIFFPELIANNIDTLLILGDTFDRRKFINFYSLDRAKKMFFDKLKLYNITVYMLVGNHDVAHKNNNLLNSPELLLNDYDNIHVISHPCTKVIKGVPVCFVPWINPENNSECMQELQNSPARICMGHFEIAGFAMYKGAESHGGLDSTIFGNFTNVFSGHYHHRSNNGNIYYLGNPYELTWSDYNDPRGFHFYNLTTLELTFKKNTNSIFTRLEYDDKLSIVDLDSIDLSNNYVKLVVINKTNLVMFDNFVKKLSQKNCAEIKILENFEEYSEGELESDVDLEDTESILSSYIDSLETNIDVDDLKRYIKNLYIEAINID